MMQDVAGIFQMLDWDKLNRDGEECFLPPMGDCTLSCTQFQAQE